MFYTVSQYVVKFTQRGVLCTTYINVNVVDLDECVLYKYSIAFR